MFKPFTILKLFTLLVCLLLVQLVAAQDKSEPSQKESYQSLKKRSSQRNTEQLLREAEQLKKQNPDEALNRVKEALAMSIAQGDVRSEANAYILLAEINEDIIEWKLARDNYQAAHDKLVDLTNTVEYQKTLKGLGYTNLKLGNTSNALNFYRELLTYPLNESDKNETLLNISEVYYQMEQYDQALQTIESIKSTPSKIANPMEARIQNQKAKIYARMKEVNKSQELYSNSLNTLRSAKPASEKEQQVAAANKEEIVEALQEQNRYDEAIDIRKQAIEYNLESNNLAEVTKDKVAISKTLDAKGETTAALKEAEEAAQMADTLNNPKEKATAYLTLANLYDKSGQSKQALSAYKKYSDAVSESEQQTQATLLEKSDLIKKQRDIEQATKDVSIGQREETIEQATVFRQQLIIYGLLFVILIIGVTSYFIYKNAKASKLANQLLALKSLRSQMNPHFIFNALNSVNHFIAQQDERTANRYLSEFAQLMRSVLEHSQEDLISLSKELEILSLYLKLEHYRFREKFDYEIKTDETIDSDTIEVPPMLIQPYLENAVWHGLRYKEGKGKLTLEFNRKNGHLLVVITDDGIGRKKSNELKTVNQKKHNSTGIKNIEERLSILNHVYKTSYQVTIDDLSPEGGTRVSISIPIKIK